jgi:hypothetical protein
VANWRATWNGTLTLFGVDLVIAALFPLQFSDFPIQDEGGSLATIPDHKISACHLTVPHLRTKRGRDGAACAVCMGIPVLGIDLLNARADPQGGGRLQWMGAHGGRTIVHPGQLLFGTASRKGISKCQLLLTWFAGTLKYSWPPEAIEVSTNELKPFWLP